MKNLDTLIFSNTGTGGGCTALCAFDKNEREYLITDGDASTPEDFFAPCVLSIADDEGYHLTGIDCEEVFHAIAKATYFANTGEFNNEYTKYTTQ